MSASAPEPALRRGPPLWIQIGLAVLATYLVAAAAAGSLLAHRLTGLAARDAERALEHHLELLEPAVRRGLTTGDVTHVQEVAERAGRIGEFRITVVRPDGEVVAESERTLPLPSHADRPEVRDALEFGSGREKRFSETVQASYLYVARRVDGEDGSPVGVLRISRPLATADTAARELGMVVLLALLLGLPVAALVGWLLARRIARPLERMTEAATRMAAGDFSSPPESAREDEAGRLAVALRNMGEELSGMLEDTRIERAELGAILSSMSEGVLALDLEGRILRSNEGVARCLGLAEAPVAGLPLADALGVPALSEQVAATLATETVLRTDLRLAPPRSGVVNVSTAPIRGSDGTIGGAVVVMRDVSELRRLERARLDFVANVSHELRTPIAAVLAALETIGELGEDEYEDRDRLLRTATRNGERLAAIVNDLLALSRIETEEKEMELHPTPVLRSVRAALGALSSEASRRGVTLEGPKREARDVRVLGHEGRLEEVWINLVENALKYTPEGGSVAVGLAVDADLGEVCVSVSDTGAGIPEAALPRIFERFYRVDKARSREQGGTGLGLAIVKHIVRAHAGRVEVESRLCRGTSFRVFLPLEPAG